MAKFKDNKMINDIRSLGLDMIHNAGSGHPGILLGAAPTLYTLFTYHLNYDLNHCNWFNRDRFVMSAGHGSALLYSMLLFYVVTFQDVNYGTNNVIPFKEILRYEVGSKMFIKNILGNIILFVPFGLFVSYIMKTRKMWPILFITVVTSGIIEYTQLKIGRTFDIDDILLNCLGGIFGFLLYIGLTAIKRHLPKFLQRDIVYNLLTVLVIVVIIFSFFNLWGKI